MTIQQAARIALPRPYYRLFLKRMRSSAELNKLGKEEQPCFCVCSLSWSDTPEGEKFWGDVSLYCYNFYHDFPSVLPPLPAQQLSETVAILTDATKGGS